MPEGIIKTIKIFLASSSELKTDRDEFETFVMRKIRQYIQDNIVLDVIRWENFVDAMSQVGLQKEYNKAIVESDIFVSLFHTKVGKYTEEEFGKAAEAFMAKGKPLVYTYFKDEPVSPSQLKKEGFVSLEDFKEKLEKLPNPHYPTYYKTTSDLKLHFGEQLEYILPKLAHSDPILGSSRDDKSIPFVNEPLAKNGSGIDPFQSNQNKAETTTKKENQVKNIETGSQDFLGASKQINKIFISHASKNQKIVGLIIDVLEAVGIKSRQIFCSSFEGYAIDLGQNFLDRLRAELDGTTLVLFVLTKDFYNSPTCLCEMGAAWIKIHDHIPILVPPLDFEDVKGVMPLTQGMKINDASKLNSLKAKLEKIFSLEPDQNINIWERKRDNLLERIEQCLQQDSQDDTLDGPKAKYSLDVNPFLSFSYQSTAKTKRSDFQPTRKKTDFEFDDKVFALLIGIDKYENGVDIPGNGAVHMKDSQFTNLQFCAKDVFQFKEFLVQHKVDYIKDLTKPDETSRASILKELKQFSKKVNLEAKKLDKDPLVIIFISCHGITEDGDDSYFIPYDGDRSNLVGTAIPHSILRTFLTELKTSKVVVLLDSCHSGGFAQAGEKGNLQHDQIANLADAESMFVIASCKPDQKSREEEGNGIFTIELLRLLEDSYLQINDENISTSNLWEPLRQNVLKASDFRQEPVTNSKTGIILGKNIKRKKENEIKNDETRLKRQEFLKAIESILDAKNKEYAVAAELSFFIATGRFENGFENFLSTFDRYSNEFSRNRQLTIQDLETKCDVLLNQYIQIKSLKGRSSPANVSTDPTEAKPVKDPIDKSPVVTTEKNCGAGKERREGVVLVVKRFSEDQIERIVGPINTPKYYDEVNSIDRTLSNGVTEQIFMNKMRALARGAEERFKNDNYILDGIREVVNQFMTEWPNGIDTGPKNSLSVRF